MWSSFLNTVTAGLPPVWPLVAYVGLIHVTSVAFLARSGQFVHHPPFKLLLILEKSNVRRDQTSISFNTIFMI